ncbi:hypothetical protein L198_02512 [Cryptococcus wingfieldii CBS 7118]|uniref:Uncharacterized protein n=1 Tax=Cryptococcus wingfieldii CBS 7118 TaxID=1295528 RepID=A0A1E3JS01_9TREE|nr:hypothetical protein L198_02512 [Cryptococcus wingfieldii CBS 7118]ODO03661.1 hypothetical protein L198_02512 [Cryptococcus wingfieldii CBS 7118]
MAGSKYESRSSYHKGGTSASSTYNHDGSVSIAPSETPSQLDQTTTAGASRMTRSEYIAQHRRLKQARREQEELDKDPTFKPDRSALSSGIPMATLKQAPRLYAKAKTEDAEAVREKLERGGWTIMTTDNEAEDGYTTFSYVDTPFLID